MNENKKSTKAFQLSLISGLLILTNTLLLGIVTTWFPGFLPTLPGQTANDPTILYQLTALVLIFGSLVFLSAILLRIKPTHKKIWGTLIIVFSVSSVITGGGFIIGFILGILGGTSVLLEKN
jgi:Family of unknown function (DUF6114)